MEWIQIMISMINVFYVMSNSTTGTFKDNNKYVPSSGNWGNKLNYQYVGTVYQN